ncbi:MAG: ABC transporter ATP-binding protein [Acetobacteraceae bacterium]|nr:ABC transporter ATP-binding protein [Acetobacteraceae bacterium]
MARQESAEDGGARAALCVRDLSVHIPLAGGKVLRAVDGVGFELRRGETLGLVGESGSGKTMTAMAVMRLLEGPLAGAVRGQVLLDGVELLGLDETAMSRVRGAALGMVFQEPMTSLNPVMRIGRQIAEPLRRHLGLAGAGAADRAVEMLRLVRIPDPGRAMALYPHELSGGMRQRVMIAIALACRPGVLIADEPTTALDVTIQAQILALMGELQASLGTAILLITHDLAVIAETAHRVAVMYAGRIVEIAPVAALFAEPRHPYTQGLLASIPRITHERAQSLHEIQGSIADAAFAKGCAFAPRCPRAAAICAQLPVLEPVAEDHEVACWRHRDG